MRHCAQSVHIPTGLLLAFYPCDALSRFELELCASCVLKPADTEDAFVLRVVAPESAKFLSVVALDGEDFEHYDDSIGRIYFELFHFKVKALKV